MTRCVPSQSGANFTFDGAGNCSLFFPRHRSSRRARVFIATNLGHEQCVQKWTELNSSRRLLLPSAARPGRRFDPQGTNLEESAEEILPDP